MLLTHIFFFECNKERGPIDQLYIELGSNLVTFLVSSYQIISVMHNGVCFMHDFLKALERLIGSIQGQLDMYHDMKW